MLEPAAWDLFAADVLTGHPAATSSTGELVAVRWDGHRHQDWMNPADLIPAAAVTAAVA